MFKKSHNLISVFLTSFRYFSHQVATQLVSRDWVDPVLVPEKQKTDPTGNMKCPNWVKDKVVLLKLTYNSNFPDPVPIMDTV